jgi:protein-disulfide isomerase
MLRLASVSLVALAAAALAGCTKDAAKGPGAAPGATTDTAGASATAGPADDDSRLARLERRIARIEQVLGPRLGPPEADAAATYAVKVSAMDPIEGPKDAKVTVIEGFEFACPYCLKANPVVEQLRAEFPADVRVVTKYLVVHDIAVPSGLAACAANQQGRFTEMKNLIWTKSWGPDGRMIQEKLSPETMLAYAAELGLDAAKFKADMEGQPCMDWLRESRSTLGTFGMSGTPGFFINGRHLGGLVPLEAMKQLVTEELAKADKAIAAGVAKADFYDTVVVGKGLTEVAPWFPEAPAAK